MLTTIIILIVLSDIILVWVTIHKDIQQRKLVTEEVKKLLAVLESLRIDIDALENSIINERIEGSRHRSASLLLLKRLAGEEVREPHSYSITQEMEYDREVEARKGKEPTE